MLGSRGKGSGRSGESEESKGLHVVICCLTKMWTVRVGSSRPACRERGIDTARRLRKAKLMKVLEYFPAITVEVRLAYLFGSNINKTHGQEHVLSCWSDDLQRND
jgi:hypothetical protein